MKESKSNLHIIGKQMLRLLPVQILLALVNTVNNLVSSYFATNYVGIDAMSAVGLYGPVSMLITSIATMLAGGCAIICGKYLGQNERDKLQKVFSLDLAASTLVAILFTVLAVCLPLFDLTGIFTRDPAVRPIFNRYLLGQAIGMIPLVLGNQLPAFLSMENKGRRTMTASLVYIAINLVLDYVFVQILRLEEFGLALASSLGLWVFLAIQAHYFLSGKSMFRLSMRKIAWSSTGEIVKVGFPGAASNIFQTVRGLIVNNLLEIFVGSIGLSAFAAANNLMGIFWAIPGGMLAVSRLMISISVGEEDRQSLCDVMRVMFRRYLPMMLVIDIGIIALAGPLSSIFFRDTSSAVYAMMASGLRILPLCMPLSIIMMHFACYGQASGKQAYVIILALLDGVVCVAGFSFLLIGKLGINGVYIANVLNGVVTTIYIIGYAWYRKKAFPRNMEQLMVIPDEFGVPEEDRIDLTVTTVEEVVKVAENVQRFCLDRGIDKRRAYLAGLAMEEMAGNVVEHGFTKDSKKHSVDIRVAHKDSGVILRIRDDCVPFDPEERVTAEPGDDVTKNIGIRMIYSIMKDITYQNLVGLNVLTIRI